MRQLPSQTGPDQKPVLLHLQQTSCGPDVPPVEEGAAQAEMKRTPLKRGSKPLKRYTPLKQRSKRNSRRPAETNYLNWIRTLPCAVCDGAKGKSEAAHTSVLGRSGMASKATNRSCIPLCPPCHRLESDSYHQLTPEWRWADYHGLDLPCLVRRLNEAFALRRKAA